MELHVLIDFENVQPTYEDVHKLAPSFTDLWLFHGPQQIKTAQQWAAIHERVTLVPISKPRKAAPVATNKSCAVNKLTPLKKAAPTKNPAKSANKASEKKSPVKKSPAARSINLKLSTHNVPVKLKVIAPAQDKEFIRIQKGFAKMGNKAPNKLKSFLRHIAALLGKESTPQQMDAVVQNLQRAGVVTIAGNLVLYPSK